MKKSFILGLALASTILGLTGCNRAPSAPSSSVYSYAAEESEFTLTFIYVDGSPIENAAVTITGLNDGASPIEVGTTNDLGKVTFDAKAGTYGVSLAGLADGYFLDENAKMNGAQSKQTFVVESKVITGKSQPKTYKVGDIMVDYTFKTSESDIITLSETLEEKKFVLLNCWGIWCGWCQKEFPYMETAYEAYSDDVSIHAVSDADTNSSIADFKEQKGLTFDMGADTPDLSSIFVSITKGYPTSVFIDRYGRIEYIEAGAIMEDGVFEAIFEHYTADDYVPGTLDLNNL